MGKFPKQADMCVDVGNAIEEEEEKQMIIHIPRYLLKYPSFSLGRGAYCQIIHSISHHRQPKRRNSIINSGQSVKSFSNIE